MDLSEGYGCSVNPDKDFIWSLDSGNWKFHHLIAFRFAVLARNKRTHRFGD